MPAYSSKRSTPPARRRPACSTPTTRAPRARSCARRRWCRSRSTQVARRPARSADRPAASARTRLQHDRPRGLDAPARRPGRLRPAARARADRARRRSRGRAPARARRAPAQRGQRRLAVRARAGQRAARVRRRLPRRRRRRRAERRARRGARAPRRRPRGAPGAARASLIGATLYPAIVSLIAIVIVIFLVTYVVPQVAIGVREHQARAAAADDRRCWRSAPSCAAGAGCSLLRRWRPASARSRLMLRNEAFRERFDAGWLDLPLVGRLARGYNAARFAGTLAMLAGAGVPILKALQAAAETLSQPRHARRRDGRAGAGARRRAARLGAGRQEALSRHAGDVLAPRRADRPAAADARARRQASSAPKCSAARCRWRRSSSRC